MKQYRNDKKNNECSNKFCDKKAEYFENEKGFCLVHYLLYTKKEIKNGKI